MSISYIDPRETDSLSIQCRQQSFPAYAAQSYSEKEYYYSGFAYFWCGNLNTPSARAIHFNFGDGFSSGMKKISDNFLDYLGKK